MAVSRVTMNSGNISKFFSDRPLGGTSAGSGRGLGGGDANALAARMALAARIEAGRFHQRTSSLVSTVRPFVRKTPAGTEVGVTTGVEHGYWLEVGTDFHIIHGRPFLKDNPAGPKGPVPDDWVLEGKHRSVPHPGNPPFHWMSDAVRSVVPGRHVTVRKLF